MTTPMPPEPEPSASPKGSERRAAIRVTCKVQVYCRPGAGQTSGPWWQGTVLDVSTRGVRLLLTHRIEAGTPMTITLPGAPVEGKRRVLGARVVRVIETDMGWAAGCLLLGRKLSEEEIRILAGEPSEAES